MSRLLHFIGMLNPWLHSTFAGGSKADLENSSDVIVLGAGLAGGLLGYFVKVLRPEWKVRVFEREHSLTSQRTWSFHLNDVSSGVLPLIAPLCRKFWSQVDVQFPGGQRRLDLGYASINSGHFFSMIQKTLGPDLILGADVCEVSKERIRLGTGEEYKARCVLDARGFLPKGEALAHQKFVGHDLELESPHGLERPVVMNALCDQKDGYRFFYVLPWDTHRVLVEDTYYSEDPFLDVERCRDEIARFVSVQGWKVHRLESEESASLPIPLSVEKRRRQDFTEGAIPIGMRGGFYHATTGYSLLHSARIAFHFAKQENVDANAWSDWTWRFHQSVCRKNRFFVFLNRMLFWGAPPEKRFLVLARFYRLPEALISRFYASQLRWQDYVRLLWGKPPIRVWPAVRILLAYVFQNPRRPIGQSPSPA